MKKLIDLNFFTKIFYPSHLKARGETLYCIGKKVDMDRNAYNSDLYRIDGDHPVRLTASHDVQDYTLLDDGIVFASMREAKDKERAKGGEPLTVYQKLPYDGGEAQECLRLGYTVMQAEWLGDDRLLFTAVIDHTLNAFLVEHGGDMEKALKDKREQDESLTCVDELPFWFNGQGFINKKRVGLFLYEKGDVRELSVPYAGVQALKVSDDKTRALFTQTVYESVQPMENELFLLDIASGDIKKVKGVPVGSIDDLAFGPEDSIILLHTPKDAPYGMIAGNPNLCRIPLKGGKMKVLDDSGMYNYHNSVGSDVKLGTADEGLRVVGDTVLFNCTVLHNSQIMAYDLKGHTFRQITQQDGMVQEWIPYGDGYAVLAMRENGLGDVYTVDGEGQETRVCGFNDKLLAKYEIVTPIALSYTNAEGTEIHGWVMPPVDYVPGKVYPAILNIHGGPKTAYGSVFFHEMQYWCAQGFAVMFCNPTGGDGRGNAFADIRGRYGSVDYDDIMGFVDTALTRFGFISAVRLGVTGGSYGGFMTNWIIGHTDRFRAAASQRSIANWLGFNNTSDIGYTFGGDQMQGTPWDAPEKLWGMSPLKYADKVKTPTLFIHSEEDYRCNMFEGIQMYYALRSFGVDSRLCLFRGENHELSRSGKPKNRIRRLQEITRWMDKYLKAL